MTQLRPLDQPPLVLGQTPINDRAAIIMTGIQFKNMPFAETEELIIHEGNLVVRVEKEGYTPQVLILPAADKTIDHQVVLEPVESQ